MTAIEFLRKKNENFSLIVDSNKSYSLMGWINLMEEYHQAKLKLLDIAPVVGTLNHDDLSIGEKVLITQTKLVEINSFREDGNVDVEDTVSIFTVGIDEISKVV